jgi:hypothetical protein
MHGRPTSWPSCCPKDQALDRALQRHGKRLGQPMRTVLACCLPARVVPSTPVCGRLVAAEIVLACYLRVEKLARGTSRSAAPRPLRDASEKTCCPAAHRLRTVLGTDAGVQSQLWEGVKDRRESRERGLGTENTSNKRGQEERARGGLRHRDGERSGRESEAVRRKAARRAARPRSQVEVLVCEAGTGGAEEGPRGAALRAAATSSLDAAALSEGQSRQEAPQQSAAACAAA